MIDSDTPAWPADAVEVGRIIGAWGIKGFVRVLPYAGQPQALLSSRRWYLQADPGPVPGPVAPRSPSGAQRRAARVTGVKTQGEYVVAQVDGTGDRAAAEALKGTAVFVPRSSFPTPEPGEYYWVDLLGLAVVNRQGDALGTVAEMIDTGAHSVLAVDLASQGDARPVRRLIPFVAAYIDGVDLDGRTITVDWGLDF